MKKEKPSILKIVLFILIGIPVYIILGFGFALIFVEHPIISLIFFVICYFIYDGLIKKYWIKEKDSLLVNALKIGVIGYPFAFLTQFQLAFIDPLFSPLSQEIIDASGGFMTTKYTVLSSLGIVYKTAILGTGLYVLLIHYVYVRGLIRERKIKETK